MGERSLKPVFTLKSYRVIPSGGKDASGKYRGFNVERRSKGEWKFLRFRTDAEEAIGIVRDAVLLGKKP